MVVNKRKKVTRYRGSKTHGGGAMKKRRGAGSRGGRGMAGTGRKADVKKPSIWKNKKYFGRYGFKKKNVKVIRAVNLMFLEENIDRFLKDKKAKEEGDVYTISLTELGFDKLLSKGKVTKKFRISCSYASKKAIDSVKKAGGEVLLN